MKMIYLGAASLMALGAAACGENAETQYAEDEDTTETAAYEDDEQYQDDAALEDEYDTALADDPTMEDPAMEDDMAMADDPALQDSAPIGQEPSGTAASVQPASMTIVEVETQDDLTQLLDNSFRTADVDQNDQLSREEFDILIATLAPAGATQSGAMGQEQTGMEGEGDISSTEPAGVSTDQEIFAEAAGTGDSVEKESLRTAFLERFETADQDGNDRLSPEERDEFVRIALGGDSQTQPYTPEQNQQNQ